MEITLIILFINITAELGEYHSFLLKKIIAQLSVSGSWIQTEYTW